MMRIPTPTILGAFAALAALALPGAAQAQQDPNVINVSSADAAMNAAIAKARQQLPDFFAHFAKPQPGENGFVVKFDLLPEPGKAEYIWAEVISRQNGVTIARLSNTPLDPRFKLGEKVNIADADVIDWGYWRGGVMQGHHTTRVLLNAVPPAQATEIRKSFGW